jgi:hypothetical protein
LDRFARSAYDFEADRHVAANVVAICQIRGVPGEREIPTAVDVAHGRANIAGVRECWGKREFKWEDVVEGDA